MTYILEVYEDISRDGSLRGRTSLERMNSIVLWG